MHTSWVHPHLENGGAFEGKEKLCLPVIKSIEWYLSFARAVVHEVIDARDEFDMKSQPAHFIVFPYSITLQTLYDFAVLI